MENKKKSRPAYIELEAENKKLVKEISQIAIKNVLIEKQLTREKMLYDDASNLATSYFKQLSDLKDREKVLKDISTQYTKERAYLTTTLVEIVNCEEIEVIKRIAEIAIGSIRTPAKKEDKIPF
jgi:hypothetical protein